MMTMTHSLIYGDLTVHLTILPKTRTLTPETEDIEGRAARRNGFQQHHQRILGRLDPVALHTPTPIHQEEILLRR